MYYINGKKFSYTQLEVAKKNNRTISDLAEEYGISEEEMRAKIELFPGASNHLRKLRSNENLRKRNTTNYSEEVSQMEDVAKSREEELEELIYNLDAEIGSLSKEEEGLGREIVGIDAEIGEVQQELIEIAEKVKARKIKIKTLSESRKEKIERSEAISAIKSQKEASLAQAKVELESYQKVLVSYGEGGINISKDEFKPSAKDVESKRNELSNSGNFDDYALKYIKAAAEVLCAVEYLQVMEIPFSIEYEKCIPSVNEILNVVFAA